VNTQYSLRLETKMSLEHLESYQLYAVEQLVGTASDLVPEQVIPQRRQFFRQLVLVNAQHGIQLVAPPFISKLPVDLHRLYISVLRRGGFKQVTKDKSWKALCSEANPQLSESSAAGYQLRLNYQKFLLELECTETGQKIEDLIEFVETLRKRKKEPETGSEKKPKMELGDDSFADNFPMFDEEINVVDIEPSESSSATKKVVKRDAERLRRTSQIATSPEEQRELDLMSQQFKKKRLELEYSQKEVAESICGVFETDMSQTTISRFETIKLSVRNMKSVKILLDDWVEKVNEALEEGKTAAEFLKESKQLSKEKETPEE